MKLLSPDIPLESEVPVIKAESILSGSYVPGLIVLCLIILTSVSVQGAEDDFRVLRDFSQGPQGWRYHSPSGGGVPEIKTTDGKRCIAVPASFPDPVQLYKQRRSRGILGPIRIVRAEVHVPRGSENVEISFFAKDRDGHWFYALPRKPLQSGTWNTVTFDVSPGSRHVFPDGHFSIWGDTEAYLASVVGIQIYSRSHYRGEIGIRRIEGKGAKAADSIHITDLELPKKNVWVYEKYEAAFMLSREFENPFDPEQISVTGEFTDPDGTVREVYGFFYRDFIRRWDRDKQEEVLVRKGRGKWKLLYAPLVKGKHTFKIKASAGSDSVESREFTFNALPPRTPGYIAPDNRDPRYFAFSDGSFFYPVGHNVRSPNDPRCARVLGIDVPPDRGTFAYDSYFKHMSENGENCLEIWMCSWWVGLEWTRDWNGYHGFGYYNLENAWKLDYLISLAEHYGMYIHLVIDNHGKLSTHCDPEWDFNPYNRKNGGFLSHPNEFFTNKRAEKLYRRKLRYILARWGWSPRIMGFELWSELNLVGRRIHKRYQVYQWHRDMADMIHAYPFPRMVTTHYSGNYKVVDPVMARLKQIDYVVGDGYREKGIMPDLVQPTAVRYRSFRKPGLITEYGGSWHGTTEARLRGDLHSGLWAGFLTDLAGTPLFWWFEQVERRNLYFHYRAFSRFIEGEDKRGRKLGPVDVSLAGPDASDFDSMSAVDRDGGYVWVYSRAYMLEYPELIKAADPVKGMKALIHMKRPGTYTVEVWNTVDGSIIGSSDQKTAPAHRLLIDLPEFRIDCALKLKRKK